MEFGQLSQNDYKKILRFYKQPIHKNKYTRKKVAENILAKKLCRCIKKVSKNKMHTIPEAKRTRISMKLSKAQANKDAVGICRNSVITRKNLKNFGFSCKKKMRFRKRKNHTYKLLRRLRPIKKEIIL